MGSRYGLTMVVQSVLCSVKQPILTRGETTAEVAAFSKDDNFMVFQDGGWVELPVGDSDVMPRQTPEDVSLLIQTLSNL